MKTFRTFPKNATPTRGKPSRWGIAWYLLQQRRKRAGAGSDIDPNALGTEAGLVITTEDGQQITIE